MPKGKKEEKGKEPSHPHRKEEKGKEPSHPHRKTNKYMTKFEYAKVIGTRAVELTMGAEPMIHVELKKRDAKGREVLLRYDPIVVAREELRCGVIPMEVHRTLPDGSIEVWNANELINFN